MDIDCVSLCEKLASELDCIMNNYQERLALLQHDDPVIESSGKEISTIKIGCQNTTKRVLIDESQDVLESFNESEGEKLITIQNTSAKEQRISELVDGVHNQIRLCSRYSSCYQQIKDNFDSQRALSSLNPHLGLCLFFLKLINLLKDDILLLKDFLESILLFVPNMLFASIVKNCIGQDDDRASFHVFGCLSYLIRNSDMDKWNYWANNQPKIIKRLPSDFKTLLEQALQHQEIKRCYQTIFYNFNDNFYKIATDSALLRTRIINPWQGGDCHAFTTSNLYIFIQKILPNSPSVVFCGIFIILLHELGHYLRRCRCITVGEVRQVKTPKNTELNLSEGGEEIERMLFGGKVSFVSEEGANYLYNNISSFSTERFKNMIKVGELQSEDILNLERRGLILKRAKVIKRSCILGID